MDDLSVAANGVSLTPLPVRFALGAVCAALHLKERVMNLIKEVRAAWVAREIARLMPAVSYKAEPVAQRRNPARAAKKAARKETSC